MFGKGMFIWKIKNASGGDVDVIARTAAEMGLNYLAVKVNRGYWSYNWRQLPSGQWVDDYIPALKQALDPYGIKLFGWGDAWLLNGAREAGKAVERIEKHGLAGYFIDAEAQAKQSPQRHAQANYYSIKMGEVDVPVLLCSYRYPSLHPELPWTELLECCTHHAPQVYWIHGSNPELQLAQSIQELLGKKELPFVPAGPAFDEHGWKPTEQEMEEFNTACIEQCCDGVVWWEYDEAEDNGFFSVIKEHDWSAMPAPPPTMEEKVELLWKWHPELWEMS